MTLTEKYFFSLEGKWIFNRSTNGFGDMTGSASFLPLPNDFSTFSYRETGIFVTPQGMDTPFYREYLYCLNKRVIEVYFSIHQKKQGLFHTLTFSSHTAMAIHPCRDDIYTATYTFLDDSTFMLRYDVKGPAKDIIIETVFKKLHPPGQNKKRASDLLTIKA